MRLPDAQRLKRGRAAVIDCRDDECRLCLSACGFSAIRIEDGKLYSAPEKCVGCGGCAGVCPKGFIRLIKDRGDGTFEVTVPIHGELPEIDDLMDIVPFTGGGTVKGRVIQALPKRPNAGCSLVRAITDKL